MNTHALVSILAALAMSAVTVGLAEAATSTAPESYNQNKTSQCARGAGILPGFGSPRCRMQAASAAPENVTANPGLSLNNLPPHGGSGVPAFMYGRLQPGHH